MKIVSLIASIDGWQDKSPAELLAELSEPTELIEDPELYTWGGVADVIGDANAGALCDALVAAGKLWAVHQLGGRGLNLARPDVQQQLLYLDSIGVPGVRSLAEHVRKTVSKLAKAGIETTLEEIAKVQLVEKTRLAMLEILHPVQAKATAVNAWLDELDLASMTIAEVEAYCASLLESGDGNPTGGL